MDDHALSQQVQAIITQLLVEGIVRIDDPEKLREEYLRVKDGIDGWKVQPAGKPEAGTLRYNYSTTALRIGIVQTARRMFPQCVVLSNCVAYSNGENGFHVGP